MKEEFIDCDRADPTYWICICENTSDEKSFSPCHLNGTQYDQGTEEEPYYICHNCGRIIESKTLKVVGRIQQSSLEKGEVRETSGKQNL